MQIALHGTLRKDEAMLDFEGTEVSSEKQTRTTQMRHGEGLARLIERASKALASHSARARP